MMHCDTLDIPTFSEIFSFLFPFPSFLLVDCVCLHSFTPFSGTSVTALSFGPPLGKSLCNWMLACGAESGDINYWDLGPSDSKLIHTVKSAHCHGSTVKKLAWTPDSIAQPFVLSDLITDDSGITQAFGSVHVSGDHRRTGSDGHDAMQGTVDPLIPSWRIASCGEDHTVRIFRITQ